VEIGTTNTSKFHSVKALLDSGVTGSFIDQYFVCLKGINTQTLSHNILVFNVDSSLNKAGQISKVVDILLHYKTHSERMLLAISKLGKQSLILGYNWLKDHNPKINWEKREVEIVTNFIQPYLHQFFENLHSLNGSQKPLKRPFDQYQSRLKAINNG